MAADPYKYFRVEARELLEQLGSGVAAAEHEASSSGVQRLLRLAHTLKGAARVVRQAEIATLAHDIEDRLEPFREAGGPVPPADAVALLELVDAIGVRVRALTPPDQAAAPRDDEAFRTLRADVTEMDALLDGIAEAQAWAGELRRAAGGLRQARGRTGSVEAGLDALQASVEAERRLEGTVQGLERELRQVRSAGEQLRLLPVGTLFASLERVVGDTARTLGKRAVFRGRGAEIRLDGPVLGALQAALVQAVRNAVAHGLELEAERAAAGKPPDGEVLVEVAARGSRVAVTCRDDGRGVDLAAVRAALRRRGAISASEAVSSEDLLERLLGAGITTSSAVSEVSGRGVGLDVVREAMARLAGKARLQTIQGRGTTLEMVVPVSLSSLDALMVEAAGVTAAIPVAAVRRTLRIEAASAGGGAPGEAVEHEGALLPLVPLAQVLAARAGLGRRGRSVVIVAGAAGTAAFGVDRVRGRETLLVRALPALAAAHPVVSGLTLDGDGNPQPVLDPDRLVESAGRGGASGDAVADPARADPGRRRLVDHADAGAEHPRVGRLLRGSRQLGRGGVDQGPAPDVQPLPRRCRNAGHGRLRAARALSRGPRPRRHSGHAGDVTPIPRRPRSGSRGRGQGLHREERVRPGGPPREDPGRGGMSVARIRVLVVEDSATVRGHLCEVLGGDPEIEVVGVAADGKRAIELCQSLRPDVMTLDMMLPIMSGLAATEFLMAHCPTPILIVSSSTNRGELFKTYEALAAGALDVFEKPGGKESDESWDRRLVSTVKLLSRIKVITHPRGRLPRPRGSEPASVAPASVAPARIVSSPRPASRMVAVGASTGGPGAIVEVLRGLPAPLPVPVFVVLHIGEPFGKAFAEWLDGQTGHRVRYAVDGEALPRGNVVLMAPPERHLVLRDGRLALTDDPERHSCRPSVDVLFESLARENGAGTAAALLTGMGRDGAAGLLAIRSAGGLTLAQDEATSVVYGMPREAALLGAAERILAIGEIGPALSAAVLGVRGDA